MRFILGIFGSALLAIVTADAFKTVVVARQTQSLPRATRVFYRLTWPLFIAVARRIKAGVRRENYLSVYGPVSLFMLLACWPLGLIMGFTILQWSIGLQFNDSVRRFADDIHFSACSSLPWAWKSKLPAR